MRVNMVLVLSSIAATGLGQAKPPQAELSGTVVFVCEHGTVKGRAADVTGAVRIVGIGVDLTSSRERGDAPLDTWEGIPPASERYAASRDALRARIEGLLDNLEREEPGR